MHHVRVTDRDIDLQAGKSVYEGYSDGFELLARYFADLAASWRRWTVETVVALDVGEQLSQAARDIASVVRS